MYILLHPHIALSYSNVDIRIAGKISQFTDALVHRHSPSVVEDGLM